MRENKNLWIGIAVVLLVLAGGLYYAMNRQSPEVIGDASQVEDTSSGSINENGTAMPYTDALANYYGARIELDDACQGKPNNLTFKTGGTLMLDNKSTSDRVIKVGTAIYNLKANSFKIIRLEGNGSQVIACDQNENAGKVIVNS